MGSHEKENGNHPTCPGLAPGMEACLVTDLERDDVLAALEYGALAAGNRRIPLAG